MPDSAQIQIRRKRGDPFIPPLWYSPPRYAGRAMIRLLGSAGNVKKLECGKDVALAHEPRKPLERRQ